MNFTPSWENDAWKVGQTTLCFEESKEAFEMKQIPIRECFQNYLAHVVGLRHPGDDSDSNLTYLVTTDPIAGAFKIWMLDSNIRPVQQSEIPALQSLIYSTWNWDSANIELYGDIKERAQALSPDFRVSLFQVLIAIAFVRGHTDLLKSLFATRPPEETIFDILNASKVPPEKYDLAAWTMVLNSTWIHRANASWRLEGWTNILISHMNDVPEDDAGKLEAFVKALKSHNFTPIVETLEPVVSSGTAASVYNLSIFFSVYPARSLGPSRNSLLRMAALENRATKLPIIRVLLTAGLDPNWIAPKRDYTPTDLRGDDWPELWGQTDRETALHVAARQGDLELAKLLVKHGARKWVKDGLGKTAKQRAEEHGQSEMVKYLRGWFFGLG